MGASQPQARLTDQDLLELLIAAGVQEIVSVPCSITDTWQWLAAQASQQQRLRLFMTNHEGNLAGIACGLWLGSGRPALVHLQNSGLFNAGDGFVTLAGAEVYQIPLAALVTWRGGTLDDDSEPHQAIGQRSEALCRMVFGEAAQMTGTSEGEATPEALIAAIEEAHAGGMGVLRLAPGVFQRTAKPALPTTFAGLPKDWLRRLRDTKGERSRPESLQFRPVYSRDEALLAIADAHPKAAMVYSNGYTCRAAQACVDRPGSFYNVGCMGSSLAIGWGLAISRPDLDVVVVDGDQNAQMSCMKDHVTAQYPPNLHWYILNNHLGASVGVAESLPLSPLYDCLARVIETRPDAPGTFPHPRVRPIGANLPAHRPTGEQPQLAHLARGFRAWVEAQPREQQP